jgi:hypothetical protein
MKFRLLTLIDITRTGARKGDDVFEQLQQQNFLTALQTISLRANPIIEKNPTNNLQNIQKLGFGENIKGKQRVWSLDFNFESEDQHSLEFLKQDFDLVPVIDGLDETVKLESKAFLTNGNANRNTIFINFDK